MSARRSTGANTNTLAGAEVHTHHAMPAAAALLPETLRNAVGRLSPVGVRVYDVAGYFLVGVAWLEAAVRRLVRRRSVPWPRVVAGPDGTRLVYHGAPFRGRAGVTYGNVIHLAGEPSGPEARVLLNHEYVHVLQARHHGLGFLARYLLEAWRAVRRGEDYYRGNAMERQAYELAGLLAARPNLPDLWELGARPNMGSGLSDIRPVPDKH